MHDEIYDVAQSETPWRLRPVQRHPVRPETLMCRTDGWLVLNYLGCWTAYRLLDTLYRLEYWFYFIARKSGHLNCPEWKRPEWQDLTWQRIKI